MNIQSDITPVKRKLYTYDDYARMPDDGQRYEILEGELVMVPAPITKHQKILRDLALIIWQFVKKQRLGQVLFAPYDVVFSKHNVLQPDILFVSKQNQHIITKDNIQGAPDLIVEVTSPSNKKRDLVQKKKIYEKFGVKEYWIVDTDENRIEVWSLKDEAFFSFDTFAASATLSSPLLKGLKIRLQEIF